ncbi:hypothetical protein E2562_000915 [Oryza meyeriana var. granulata]|uniref:F-box domain-containing protein n=1 Tax=Oryza meyeriana var. granulata TaxID=110450 RepID=A0A6G1CYF7_9ORYZ|nr:hypothetical protein E2562_000915 [Oryza meyeriana var. granulata]
MASPYQRVRHRLEAPTPTRNLPVLSDELLEEIFIRIGSRADLVRASVVCVSFRRTITASCFLRRYRSVHPEGFEPARPPHPAAPVARALLRAGDFFFDYLPPGRWPGGWKPCDARDGLVLLKYGPGDRYASRGVFPDLVACDGGFTPSQSQQRVWGTRQVPTPVPKREDEEGRERSVGGAARHQAWRRAVTCSVKATTAARLRHAAWRWQRRLSAGHAWRQTRHREAVRACDVEAVTGDSPAQARDVEVVTTT